VLSMRGQFGSTSYHPCKDNKEKEVAMSSKKFFAFTILVLGAAFALSGCDGSSGNWLRAAATECPDDDEFTKEFYLEDCDGFSNTGSNPYFSLNPNYQLILESDEEKAVITVLDETKTVDGVETRVVEERAFEWDEEEQEWVLIEISLNWFAICNRTNAVYYFGEWSRDCEEGFDEFDVCTGEESNEGSWQAGVNGALPGLIMPGTFLLGSKYFQEIARDDGAVDRGENTAMGLTVETDAGTFDDCVEVVDTNPAEGVCDLEEGDVKIYCPGVGIVQDEDLELVEIIGDF
jgi:hypothetical protein